MRISIRRISVAQMLSFQSPFEANEIWTICKATCFKQKALKIKNFFDFRSSRQMCFVEKGAIKNFPNFTEKHLCWGLFLIKVKTFSAMQLY